MIIQILIVLFTSLLFLFCLTKTAFLLNLIFFSIIFLLLAKQKELRIISINFIIFFALLALIEAYFAADHAIHKFKQRNDKLTIEITDLSTGYKYSKESDYFTVNYPEIGYGPRANAKIKAKKIKHNQEIYNVTYTIDRLGLRYSGENYDAVPVLFFGDSFTYGEGVNDNESMPYIFTKSSTGKYRGYNFGFHGYGPQQMLSTLEHEVEAQILFGQRPRYVVFQTILDHVKRSATTEEVINWSGYTSSPKYILDQQGNAKLSGTVAEYIKSIAQPKKNYTFLEKYLLNLKDQSRSFFIDHIYAENNIIEKIESSKTTLDEKDLELYIAIIAKAKAIVESRYYAEFKVILWDVAHDNGKLQSQNNDPNLAYIKAAFKKHNIDYYLVSQIIPDYAKGNYSIQKDGHPTALAHKKIANFLVNEF